MSADTYQLLPSDTILHDGTPLRSLLRDYDNDCKRLDVETMVASGDCLITLATSLDDSTKLLQDDDAPALAQIEITISTLLYLQHHYRLVRKRSEYRQ